MFDLSFLDPAAWWLVVGVLLVILEMVAPGFFLMWVGGAAVITGLVTYLTGMPLPFQFGLFAVLAIVSGLLGKRIVLRNPIESTDPLLNQRGARLIGEVVPVVHAIENGRGKVKIGDTVWNAQGSDVPAGAVVRVCGSHGSILLVNPV